MKIQELEEELRKLQAETRAEIYKMHIRSNVIVGLVCLGLIIYNAYFK